MMFEGYFSGSVPYTDPLPPRTRFLKNKQENPEVSELLEELLKYTNEEGVNNILRMQYYYYGDTLVTKLAIILAKFYENKRVQEKNTLNYGGDLI